MMMGTGEMASMAIVMVLWLIGWLLAVAGVIAVVWWAVRAWRGPRTDAALAILRERYARGEISRDEFEERRRDLAA